MRKEIFVNNKYGVSIKMCCASCINRKVDNRTRLCTAGEGTVTSDYVCKAWELSPCLEQAGKGGGNVKKSMYLKFALDKMEKDYAAAIAAAEKKKAYKMLSLAEIREMYKKKNGDIYEKWL